jgi:hypothetical protein
MTKRFRRPLSAILAAAMGVLALGGCLPGKRLGDLDGDGDFDRHDLDALLPILTANSTNPAAPAGPNAADVALPCGGPVDGDDMRRLQAALALQDAAAAGQPVGELALESQCHEGGVIGQPRPKVVEEPRLAGTLDELFDGVARKVPGFGGVYEQRGVLQLVLSDPRAESAAIAELERVFGDQLPDLPIAVVPGTYGFDDLMSWRVTARELFYAPDVVSVGVDEVRNRVRVGLESMASLEELQMLAANLGLPAGSVIFERVDRPAEFAFVDDLRQTQRPLRGGIQIRRGGNCTLGIVGRRQGVLGFLTNSHCTATNGVVNGDVFNQATSMTADRVGVELADAAWWSGGCPGNLCTHSDSAFVQIDSGVTARRGVVREEYWTPTVTDESLVSYCGQTLTKVGRTTGRSSGEVTSTCEDVSFVSGTYHYCSYQVDGASNAGDSGSPVFRKIGQVHTDDVALHGLLFGGPVGGGDSFWFTPLGAIQNQLGNITTVAGNEPPQVAITNPQPAQSIGSGSFHPITLEASFFDFEDGAECSGCEVSWASPLDGGALGTSVVVGGTASLPVVLSGQAARWIYATARDSDGNESTVAVHVVTTNTPPEAMIVDPASSGHVQAGGYTILGTSYDAEAFGPLHCSALQWSSSGIAGGTATGCYPFVHFPNPGSYALHLTVTDAGNAQDVDTHWVYVDPSPTTGPPNVQIVNPAGLGFGPGDVLLLTAWGDDPDDESPILYQWVLRAPDWLVRSDVPPQQILGSSGGFTDVQIALFSGPDESTATTSTWMPGDQLLGTCGEKANVEIEIRAQDADGQQATTPARVYEYQTPPC